MSVSANPTTKRRARRRGNGEGSIFKRSDGRWCAEVTLAITNEGKQERLTKYFRSRAEGVAWLHDIQQKKLEGKPLAPPQMLLSALLQEWLESKRGIVRRTTFDVYKNAIGLYINPALGFYRVQQLGKADIERHASAMRDASFSNRTISQMRDTLRAALNYGLEKGLVYRNVAQLVRVSRKRKRPVRVLSVSEALRLLKHSEGTSCEVLILAALVLGVREGELLGLSWSDIDLEHGLVKIKCQQQREDGQLRLVPVKTDESNREIEAAPLLIEALRRHRQNQEQERLAAGAAWKSSNRVFVTKNGTPIDARNMLRVYFRIREAASLPDLRFHDIRHSTTTLLHEAGVPWSAIQRNQGHASVRTTQDVYTHSSKDGKNAVRDTMQRIVSGPSRSARAIKGKRPVAVA